GEPMSRSKVAPPAARPQEPAPPLRLKDLRIEWRAEDPDEGPLRLSGEDLGKVLDWLEQTHQARPGHQDWRSPGTNLTDIPPAARELRGSGTSAWRWATMGATCISTRGRSRHVHGARRRDPRARQPARRRGHGAVHGRRGARHDRARVGGRRMRAARGKAA